MTLARPDRLQAKELVTQAMLPNQVRQVVGKARINKETALDQTAIAMSRTATARRPFFVLDAAKSPSIATQPGGPDQGRGSTMPRETA